LNDHYSKINKKKLYNVSHIPIKFKIIDIQLADPSNVISLFRSRGKLLKKKNLLMREWVKKFDLNKELYNK